MASFILLISVLILSVCHLGDKFILGLLLEMLKVLILWVFKVVEETVFAACVCAELLPLSGRILFGRTRDDLGLCVPAMPGWYGLG